MKFEIEELDLQSLSFTLVLLFLGFWLGVLLVSRDGFTASHTVSSIALLLTPFVGTLLGAVGAYLGIRRVQLIDKELEKVVLINRYLFRTKYCIDDLCDIKTTFERIFNDSSRYRGALIPVIPRTISRVDYDVSDLHFLGGVPSDDDGFIDLSQLDACFRNFNLVIDMISDRNKRYEGYLTELSDFYTGESQIKVPAADIEKVVGKVELDRLIHVSEILIATVDISLVELNKLFEKLQSKAARRINRNILRAPEIMSFKYKDTTLDLINIKVVERISEEVKIVTKSDDNF